MIHIKTLLIIALNICCCYFGLLLYKSMKRKKVFFCKYISFLQALKNEIEINKKSFRSFVENQELESDLLLLIKGKVDELSFLTKPEQVEMLEDLKNVSNIGESGVICAILEKRIEQLEKEIELLKNELAIKGKSYVKLSIIFGLFLTIFFI